METKYAIIDKALIHKEDKISDFLTLFEEENGLIDMIYQRNARYHPDKLILEIKMACTNTAIQV